MVARIGAEVGDWLSGDGIAVVEVAESHAHRAATLFRGLDATVHDDLTGRPRYVVARRRSPRRYL